MNHVKAFGRAASDEVRDDEVDPYAVSCAPGICANLGDLRCYRTVLKNRENRVLNKNMP